MLQRLASRLPKGALLAAFSILIASKKAAHRCVASVYSAVGDSVLPGCAGGSSIAAAGGSVGCMGIGCCPGLPVGFGVGLGVACGASVGTVISSAADGVEEGNV